MRASLHSTLPIAILLGCAHLPDATVNYYHAQTKVSFKVIRTIGCDARSNLIIANAVTPTVTHSANRSAINVIHLADLKGTFSDSDLKVEFYEDGRLKGINASATGQGEAILKTAVTLVSSLAAMGVGAPRYAKECNFIKAAGEGKPLSITYVGDADLTTMEAQRLRPDKTSEFNHQELAHVLGEVCATYAGKDDLQPPFVDKQTAAPRLAALHPALAKLKVTAGGVNPPCLLDPLWDGTVPAAQLGTRYYLPIPTPPMFGKQVFAASFLESGALASVQYASGTGTGQALNVLGAAVPVLQGETTAQKIAAIKAEADLIAQQQRLVQCQADPTACK